MKILESIVRWFKATDDQLSESIEQEHEIAFAKQDLEGMEKDLAEVTNNVGEVKATLAGLKRDLNEKQRGITNSENDARSLLDKGKEELAAKLCTEIETLEGEAKVLRTSIEQQENMLKTLEEKRKKLQDAVHQAESSLRMMQTMDSVARASEKIASVKVGDTTSALGRFKDREQRLQQRMDKAKAINEMVSQESGDSLKVEVDEALGKTKGSETLARLKRERNVETKQ